MSLDKSDGAMVFGRLKHTRCDYCGAKEDEYPFSWRTRQRINLQHVSGCKVNSNRIGKFETREDPSGSQIADTISIRWKFKKSGWKAVTFGALSAG
jgi:hypothetical protein